MRIGIFYIKAGGGHMSAALALKESFEKVLPIKNSELFEINNSSQFAQWLMRRGYALAVNYVPFFWRLFYNFFNLKPCAVWGGNFFAKYLSSDIEKVLRHGNFDKIILTHFFLVGAAKKIIQKYNLNTKIYCVVTDPFTVPVYWFLEKDVEYIVFSPQAKKAGVAAEVLIDKIKVTSPIIRSEFKYSPSKELVCRKELGFKVDDKVILVVGGGEGLRNGYAIAKTLCAHNENWKIMVVCGRDQIFFRMVTMLKSRYNNLAHVFGFVDLTDVMPSADVVISKAGPGIIFEALMLGKPLILNSYIWKQELGNVEFIVDNKLGFYEPKVNKIGETVNKIFASEALQKQLRNNIEKIKLKNGSDDIARHILEN